MTAAGPGRAASLASWHDDWSGLRVLIVGLGPGGFAAADTLAELGATVLVAVLEPDADRERILGVLGVEHLLRAAGEPLPARVPAFAPELIVAAPEVGPDDPLLAWAGAEGVPIWGELELAWRLRDKVPAPGSRPDAGGEAPSPAAWLCVAGADGLTTTAQLAARMALAGGLRAAPCGGEVPVLDAIRDPEGFDVLAVECAPEELRRVATMSPEASVVLNVAGEDPEALGAVYERTRRACVYPAGDDAVIRLVEAADVVDGCRAIGVGLGTPGPSELGLVDGILVDRAFLAERRTSALELGSLPELAEAGLASPHLVLDLLAAAALVRAIGVDPASVRAGALAHRPVPHAGVLVAIAAGVRFVDDARAASTHAAAASVAAQPSAVWLLHPGADADEIAALLRRHARRLRGAVGLGELGPRLRAAFAEHAPEVPLRAVGMPHTEGAMPQAVALARQLAEAGDTILLAPAAAAHESEIRSRGEQFADAVREALGGAADDADEPAVPPR